MKKLFTYSFFLLFTGLLLSAIKPVVTNDPVTGEDGPYLLYKNGQIFQGRILGDSAGKKLQLDSYSMDQKSKLVLQVGTDVPGIYFSVKLKEKLKNEKTEWKSPAKMFVLSDIEGNFKSFRTLLQANGVIDSAFHWSFGEGHLVLSGDFVDRGTQVMEVLWLIYSLEDQAKAAGGYVHYILGNHEIMNLDGDIRYVHGKYLEAASLLGQSYVNLLGENAELGRWLRTKNIIERIGNMLFVHGGISEAINNMNTTAGLLNEWSRPFYADSTFAFPSPQLDTIFGDLGPFWYRGYYMGQKATMGQVDSTLDKFNVKYIFTGHTIVADTITRFYNGKVFNTDLHHAKGYSEAVLKEGDRFYRVNLRGEKKEL